MIKIIIEAKEAARSDWVSGRFRIWPSSAGGSCSWRRAREGSTGAWTGARTEGTRTGGVGRRSRSASAFAGCRTNCKNGRTDDIRTFFFFVLFG